MPGVAAPWVVGALSCPDGGAAATPVVMGAGAADRVLIHYDGGTGGGSKINSGAAGRVNRIPNNAARPL